MISVVHEKAAALRRRVVGSGKGLARSHRKNEE